MTLYDGARFVSAWRWPHLRGAARGMAERGTRVTHPSFRLVALATPPRAWLGLLKGLGDRVKSALRRMITNDWGAINLNLGKSWDPGDLRLGDFLGPFYEKPLEP